MSDRPVHIVASLGNIVSQRTGRYVAHEWGSHGEAVEARYAAEALAKLLPGFDHLTLVVTEEATGAASDLKARLGGERRVSIVALENPCASTDDQHATVDIIERAIAARPEHALVIELTQGLRHMPLMYLAASAFHAGRGGRAITGAYYAMFERPYTDGPHAGAIPVLDLSPMLDMLGWAAAMERARLGGDWRGVAARLRAEAHGRANANTLPGATDALARALHAGLPLETGLLAHDLRRRLVDLRAPRSDRAGARHHARTTRRALDDLDAVLATIAAPTRKKDRIRLDDDELRRQLTVVRLMAGHPEGQLGERRDPRNALMMLREWMVNLAVLARGDAESWLTRETRVGAELALHRAAGSSAVHGVWRRVTERRNALAHVGMRPERAEPDDVNLHALITACERLVGGAHTGLRRVVDGDRVLVTPLGLSPGVLHTLLSAAGPFDAIVVVTSAQAHDGLAAALQRTPGTPEPHVILVADPHVGHLDVDTAADHGKRLTALFERAREVVVNTTGGTSALQHVATEAGRLAEAKMVSPLVRWVAAVDRRPYDAIRADPWVVGEVYPLEPCFRRAPR